MDSTHRHELQQNDLERWSSRGVEFLDRNGNLLTVLICAAALAFAAYTYWSRSTANAKARAWNDLILAQTSQKPDTLADVERNNPRSVAGAWGTLLAAETRLRTGLGEMYTNREAATLSLNTAADEFGKVIQRADLPAELKPRALFGLARCLETQCAGDATDANAAYEKVVATGDSVYRPLAEDRLKALKSPATLDFYKWFASQNPKPAAPPTSPADRVKDDEAGATSDATATDGDDAKAPALKAPAGDDAKDAPVAGEAANNAVDAATGKETAAGAADEIEAAPKASGADAGKSDIDTSDFPDKTAPAGDAPAAGETPVTEPKSEAPAGAAAPETVPPGR